jgi:trimethylamine--corrinoid protein Co-methyltransferase
MATEARRRKRGGGRAGNATRRGTAVIEQMPWNPPVNIDRPTEPLDEAGVLAIHDGAMRILEEIGIQFLNPEAVEILRDSGGCTIDGENVRMGRDFVMEMIARAPESWTITPRNPDRRITIGDRYLNFGNVSSPPSYWDMNIGRKVTVSISSAATRWSRRTFTPACATSMCSTTS